MDAYSSDINSPLFNRDFGISSTPYKSLPFEITEPKAKKNQDDDNNGNNEINLRQNWFRRLCGSFFNKDEEIKIEPKMFFACERTFLAWFQSSLLIGSIGVGLSTDKHLFAIGILLITIGIILMIYAGVKYTNRLNSILDKKSSGYHDKYGPFLLTTTITGIFIASIIDSIKNSKNLSNDPF